jgi:uncharacterized protein YndB with AHSA1/START domain
MDERMTVAPLVAVSTRRQAITGFAVALIAGLAEAQQPPMKEQPATEANKMRTSLHLAEDFQVAPQRIYDALLDSKQFAAFSGMPAEIDPKAGGAFTMFGGLVVGRNVELVPNQIIVQAWRPTHWDPDVYSIVKFVLKPQGSATAPGSGPHRFPRGRIRRSTLGMAQPLLRSAEEVPGLAIHRASFSAAINFSTSFTGGRQVLPLHTTAQLTPFSSLRRCGSVSASDGGRSSSCENPKTDDALVHRVARQRHRLQPARRGIFANHAYLHGRLNQPLHCQSKGASVQAKVFDDSGKGLQRLLCLGRVVLSSIERFHAQQQRGRRRIARGSWRVLQRLALRAQCAQRLLCLQRLVSIKKAAANRVVEARNQPRGNLFRGVVIAASLRLPPTHPGRHAR